MTFVLSKPSLLGIFPLKPPRSDLKLQSSARSWPWMEMGVKETSTETLLRSQAALIVSASDVLNNLPLAAISLTSPTVFVLNYLFFKMESPSHV